MPAKHTVSDFPFCNKKGDEVLLRATALRSKLRGLMAVTSACPEKAGNQDVIGNQDGSPGGESGQSGYLP
ncbi:MAG: hypothetical protein PHT15_01965 [Gallionellaceae bacterium]|nr:hypothetical protein [Gallionellaceae bacterium]